QELIREPLIDEDRRTLRRVRHFLHELGSVVLIPLATVRTEVSVEGLLAPRHLLRRHDRRERGNRLVAPARILEPDGERAVSTHQVTEDSLPLLVRRE